MKSGRKVMIVGALIITIVFISLVVILIIDNSSDESIGTISTAVPQANRTKEFSNFSIQNNLAVPTSSERGYPEYNIENTVLTEEQAKLRLTSVFTDVEFDEATMSSDESRYVYYLDEFVYEIRTDGKITFQNNQEVIYYELSELDESSKLSNRSELENLSYDIIEDMVGDTYTDYVFSDCYSWKKYNQSGEYVKYYVFQYKMQEINGIRLHGSPFGGISLSISPDRTLYSVFLYVPDISPSDITSIITYSDALEKVDDNFLYYSKGGFTGSKDLILHKVEIAYGEVDTKVQIGWRFYYRVESDPDVEHTVFVC